MGWIVYKHTNLVNGLIYIGITEFSLEHRWKQGYRSNPHFYSSIKKYGKENFKHEILFDNLSKEEACQKEIELIALYDATNREIGYNISLGGEAPMAGRKHSKETKEKFKQKTGNKNGFYGKHHSLETKEKLSKQRKGKKLSEEHKRNIGKGVKGKLSGEKNPMYGKHLFVGKKNPMYGKRRGKSPNAVKVAQYDLNGNFIQIFDSTTEAAQFIGLFNGSHITECCKGKRNKCGGYIWKYIQFAQEDEFGGIEDG